MVKQSRGFWVCELCSSTFDTRDEAEYHESSGQCPRSSSQFAGRAALQQQQQQQESFGQQQDSTVSPTASGLQQGSPFRYAQAGSSVPRRQPLTSDDDDTTHLTEADSVACRNIELFESSQELVGREGSRIAGQVGLRCMHCVDSPPRSPDSFVFPLRLGSVADCVRLLSDRHLVHCDATPSPVKRILEEAASRRQAILNESSSTWQEEENHHKVLVDFCVGRCQQYGVVALYPEEYGLVFQNSEMQLAGASALAEQQQQPVGNLFTPTARPSPPSGSGSGSYGSPFGSGSMAFRPQGMPSVTSGIGQQEASVTAPAAAQQKTSPYEEPPPDFPFFEATEGTWACKYCITLPAMYRDRHNLWSIPNRTPPPATFVEQHLSLCRVYHQQMNVNQQFVYDGYQESSPPFGYLPTTQMPFSPHPQTWERDTDLLSPTGAPRSMEDRATATLPTSHLPSTQYEATSLTTRSTFPSSTSPHSPASGEVDSIYQRSINFLAVNASTSRGPDGQEETKLVVEEDKLLLTDYFYWLMKQLRLVRFSEADRKTRGGKREKIKVGYGGLQCIHCADAPNSRKFFWSNVDRLANSFAEIPAHVLKCRRCPEPIREALQLLKKNHPQQMNKLPRGSQKVFFRRMWRRLHDGDPVDETVGAGVAASAKKEPPPRSMPAVATSKESPPSVELAASQSPDAMSGSQDDFTLLLERPATEAARELREAPVDDGPPSPSSRVLLAIPEDKQWLSDTDCFVRRQIEVFCATKDDIENSSDRRYRIHEGQVGIRCIHCALARGATGHAVAYPYSINGIYESVREFQRLHLDACENLPPSTKAKLSSLKGASSLSSVLRKYYVLAAGALGLHDQKYGIRSGAASVPLASQAAFVFADTSSVADDMIRAAASDHVVGHATGGGVPGSHSPSPPSETDLRESRKRKSDEDHAGSDAKKHADII